MSAKPEDRRMIFEEATGIAHFKTRKNESERKLERTHENISRYNDILSEIENQLGCAAVDCHCSFKICSRSSCVVVVKFGCSI